MSHWPSTQQREWVCDGQSKLKEAPVLKYNDIMQANSWPLLQQGKLLSYSQPTSHSTPRLWPQIAMALGPESLMGRTPGLSGSWTALSLTRPGWGLWCSPLAEGSLLLSLAKCENCRAVMWNWFRFCFCFCIWMSVLYMHICVYVLMSVGTCVCVQGCNMCTCVEAWGGHFSTSNTGAG